MAGYSYYVCMVDYGKSGQEATCNPEDTRADIVDLVRRTLKRDGMDISFVHYVENGNFEDVTEDIVAEASVEREVPSWDELHERLVDMRADMICDHRKHERA